VSRLITTSLLGSVEWFTNSPPTWKERAYQGLHDTLARVFNTNEDVVRGIRFERAVYAQLELAPEQRKGSAMFKDLVASLEGGKTGQKLKATLDIDGDEYCLYGKTDLLYADKIVDLKCPREWKGPGKFLSSTQHSMYCVLSGIPNFEYVACVLNSETKALERVERIPYTMEDPVKEKEQLTLAIRKALGTLRQDEDLWDLYLTKFCLYN
jgi:hypothetical protein